MSETFDVIVVGSGMTGGWAAKEFCERGFKTLVLERGRHVEHQGPEYTDSLAPWEIPNRNLAPEADFEHARSYMKGKSHILKASNRHFFASNEDHPYSTEGDQPAQWIRCYQLGGRSVVWGRHAYRMSELDFEANKRDGQGIDWPIRYADVAPWYDHVERFIGVTGRPEGMSALPDGIFQPPFALNRAEEAVRDRVAKTWPDRRITPARLAHITQPTEEQAKLGRGRCQVRSYCARGCTYGAYFSSLSATLPAARRTGRLAVRTDAIVERVLYDPKTGRATGVRIIDAKTRQVTDYSSRVVFLCASTIATAHILLHSASEAFPNGVANRSDAVGRYLMDHIVTSQADGTLPGFEGSYYYGRRPGAFYIPRYQNLGGAQIEPFLRGYAYQGSATRQSWSRGGDEPGVGAALKMSLRKPGPWRVNVNAYGEMLPQATNRVTLHATRKDKWGLPLAHIASKPGANETAMAKQAAIDAGDMLRAAGCVDVEEKALVMPMGFKNHEMGAARMGRDPSNSVLNGHSQAHDVPNLFITDGACMTSSGTANPALTYMAMTARAAAFASEQMKVGIL